MQRIKYITSILAIVPLLLGVWGTWAFTQLPYYGVYWFNSGQVYYVDSDSAAAASVLPGDQIISVNSFPPTDLYYILTHSPGTRINIVLQRGLESQALALPLTSPHADNTLTNLMPIFVAAGFWVTSMLVLFFSQLNKGTILFCLYCQVISIILISGNIESVYAGPFWTYLLYRFCYWLSGPIAIHAHLNFPVPIKTRIVERLIFPYLYIVAVILAIIHLLVEPLSIFWYETSKNISYLWLGCNLILIVVLLIYIYNGEISMENRRKLGGFFIGSGLGLFFCSFLLAVTVLFYPVSHSSSNLIILPLILLPISYSYSIFRHRLARMDWPINRSTALMVTTAVFLLIYYLVNLALDQSIGITLLPTNIWGFGLVLLLSLMAYPLYRLVQKGIDYLFYGGWYDYRSAVQQVIQSLNENRYFPGDLPKIFCVTIGTTIKLKEVSLLLSDGRYVLYFDDKAAVTGFVPGLEQDELMAFIRPSGKLDQKNAALPIPNSVKKIISPEKYQVAIPLQGISRLLGFLFLGQKQGKEPIDASDLDILEVTTRQFCMTLEAMIYAQQNRKLNRRINAVREEERKRIARNLHDQTIQSLAGVNFQLASIQHGENNPDVTEIQGQLKQIMADIRTICADLRPIALDSFGLLAAIQSDLDLFSHKNMIEIKTDFMGKDDQQLPENITIRLYRIIQEALVNIQKHAKASIIEVLIDIEPDKVVMSVSDNGVGFLLPGNLNEFIEQQHFGLAGIRESVDEVDGEFNVDTQPGKGCQLSITVPLFNQIGKEA